MSEKLSLNFKAISKKIRKVIKNIRFLTYVNNIFGKYNPERSR